MTTLDDETLVAMADGRLSLEERFSAERVIEKNPRAQRSILLLRLSALAIRDAFASPDYDRVPDRLRFLVETRPSPLDDRRCRIVETLGTKRRLSAVGAAAMTMAGLAWTLFIPVAPPTGASPEITIGRIDRDSRLSRALDRASGLVYSPANAVDAERFVITSTFADRFGNTCHEVQVHPAGSAHAQPDLAIACRRGGDGWQIVGAVAAASGIEVPYATTQGLVRDAVNGIVAMIGAGPTPAADGKESGQQ